MEARLFSRERTLYGANPLLMSMDNVQSINYLRKQYLSWGEATAPSRIAVVIRKANNVHCEPDSLPTAHFNGQCNLHDQSTSLIERQWFECRMRYQRTLNQVGKMSTGELAAAKTAIIVLRRPFRNEHFWNGAHDSGSYSIINAFISADFVQNPILQQTKCEQKYPGIWIVFWNAWGSCSSHLHWTERVCYIIIAFRWWVPGFGTHSCSHLDMTHFLITALCQIECNHISLGEFIAFFHVSSLPGTCCAIVYMHGFICSWW